jgi:hypothetical protein
MGEVVEVKLWHFVVKCHGCERRLSLGRAPAPETAARATFFAVDIACPRCGVSANYAPGEIRRRLGPEHMLSPARLATPPRLDDIRPGPLSW